MVHCEKEKDCQIICDQLNSCINAHIYCPADYQCDIQCKTNSCHNTTIHADQSSVFTIKTTKLANAGIPDIDINVKNAATKNNIDIRSCCDKMFFVII